MNKKTTKIETGSEQLLVYCDTSKLDLGALANALLSYKWVNRFTCEDDEFFVLEVMTQDCPRDRDAIIKRHVKEFST